MSAENDPNHKHDSIKEFPLFVGTVFGMCQRARNMVSIFVDGVEPIYEIHVYSEIPEMAHEAPEISEMEHEAPEMRHESPEMSEMAHEAPEMRHESPERRKRLLLGAIR